MNPLFNLFNGIVVDSPLPSNISYLYNSGSLLGIVLVIQMMSGLLLGMHYVPNILLAFDSIEHLMRDIHSGWLIRYSHSNGASLFFILVYLHIGRGLYYGSFRRPILWSIGVVIFFAMMATAFLGYVLPWGQMSYWGATVITNLLSTISKDLPYLIWGGFSVDNSTLNRFFALHYLLPFIIAALVALHLIALHQYGSTNPLNIRGSFIAFHPYFTLKDLIGFLLLFLALALLALYLPNGLGHPDNGIPANGMVTPHSIVPEWYFLPFYAILRAIPYKTMGFLAMILSIAILFALPLLAPSFLPSYLPTLPSLSFSLFLSNFLLLMLLGALPIHPPFTLIALFATLAYFILLLAFILVCPNL
jgi:ubiquinol-cytochrome c reductase cytochrome b subunit